MLIQVKITEMMVVVVCWSSSNGMCFMLDRMRRHWGSTRMMCSTVVGRIDRYSLGLACVDVCNVMFILELYSVRYLINIRRSIYIL